MDKYGWIYWLVLAFFELRFSGFLPQQIEQRAHVFSAATQGKQTAREARTGWWPEPNVIWGWLLHFLLWFSFKHIVLISARFCFSVLFMFWKDKLSSSFWKPVGDINLITLMYVEMLLGKAWACVGALGIPRKHLFCLGLWLGFGWDRGRKTQRLYGSRPC